MAERCLPGNGSLVDRVATGLCKALNDPRRLAQELINERLPGTPFLGDGTRECPWIVFGPDGDFYALYVQGRELVQMVKGRHDEVIVTL